jgi:PIN domain associated with the TPR-GreAB-C-PIN system
LSFHQVNLGWNSTITQSCLDFLKELIHDCQLSRDKEGGYLVKQGDQYVFHENTKEKKEIEIESYENLYNWALNNCDIIPAIGSMDPSGLSFELSKLMDQSFTDCIMAANGSESILLSDDQRLRSYAKQEWGVDGVWLQSILLVAMEENNISLKKYCNVTTSLIEAGLHYTTIDARVLFTIAKSENWNLTAKFIKIISIIESGNSDLKSSWEVSINFLFNLWDINIANSKKEALTAQIITSLTKDGTGSSCIQTLKALIKFGVHLNIKYHIRYWVVIKKWCDKRSIIAPF